MSRMRAMGVAAVVIAATAGCVAPPGAAERAAAIATPSEPAVGGILSGGTIDVASRDATLSSAAVSVLRVRNRTCDGVGTGSGFAVDAHRLVTNRHVVDGARQLTIDTRVGEQRTVQVADVATDADLAVITTKEALPQAMLLAPADPEPGQLVTVLGFPLGQEFTRRDGRIIDIVDGERFDTDGRVLRSDVAIRPGNSGGPLVDVEGRVVGVVFAVEVSNGRALALPISRLRAVLAGHTLKPVETSCAGGG